MAGDNRISTSVLDAVNSNRQFFSITAERAMDDADNILKNKDRYKIDALFMHVVERLMQSHYGTRD